LRSPGGYRQVSGGIERCDGSGSSMVLYEYYRTCKKLEIMAEYMLDIYKIRRFANGQVTSEKVSKVLKESTVKHAKRVNKNVGYKYVGRYKDMYGNYYT
jgi:hypothetical protein